MKITQPLTQPSVLPGISRHQQTLTATFDTDSNTVTVTAAALGTTRSAVFEQMTFAKYHTLKRFASYLDEALGFNLLEATSFKRITLTLNDEPTQTKFVGKVIN